MNLKDSRAPPEGRNPCSALAGRHGFTTHTAESWPRRLPESQRAAGLIMPSLPLFGKVFLGARQEGHPHRLNPFRSLRGI